MHTIPPVYLSRIPQLAFFAWLRPACVPVADHGVPKRAYMGALLTLVSIGSWVSPWCWLVRSPSPECSETLYFFNMRAHHRCAPCARQVLSDFVICPVRPRLCLNEECRPVRLTYGVDRNCANGLWASRAATRLTGVVVVASFELL